TGEAESATCRASRARLLGGAARFRPGGQLALEGLARDAEATGGLGFVAAGGAEYAQGVVFLDLVERPAGRETDRHRLGRRHRCALDADAFPGEMAEQQGALDHVAQLAHVAGPGVGLKARDLFRAEDVRARAELRGQLAREVLEQRRQVRQALA